MDSLRNIFNRIRNKTDHKSYDPTDESDYEDEDVEYKPLYIGKDWDAYPVQPPSKDENLKESTDDTFDLSGLDSTRPPKVTPTPPPRPILNPRYHLDTNQYPVLPSNDQLTPRGKIITDADLLHHHQQGTIGRIRPLLWSNQHPTEEELDMHQASKAIGVYTGSSFRPINKALYAGEIPSKEHIAHIQKLSDIIDRSRMPRDIENVWSGIKYDPMLHHASGFDGRTLRFKNAAFTSTSLEHGSARSFAKNVPVTDKRGREFHMGVLNYDGTPFKVYAQHMINFDIPKGARGLYVDHHSTNAGENEILLHPHARFHLDPNPEIFRDRHASSHLIYHWKAKLVHDGIEMTSHHPDHPANSQYSIPL